MKKLIVMLLVLGLVAAPVFAQKRQPQQVKANLPKMYGEVELAEFNAAYKKYTDYVLFNKKAKSKKQELQALSQMAAAYMNVDSFDRIEKSCKHFQGVWVISDEEVNPLDFLAKQGKLLPQEQQESYAKFLQQVELDIQRYRAMHPVGEHAVMKSECKPSIAGELIRCTESSSPFKHLQKLP